MVTIREIDGKHHTVAIGSGWQTFVCRVNGKTVKMKYKGGISYCPLCGEKYNIVGNVENGQM